MLINCNLAFAFSYTHPNQIEFESHPDEPDFEIIWIATAADIRRIGSANLRLGLTEFIPGRTQGQLFFIMSVDIYGTSLTMIKSAGCLQQLPS